jgi:uncharacterized phage protein (TIGR02220 family)
VGGFIYKVNMASGKKNYFRHDFNARNDSNIDALIRKFGLSGYYYYFSLVEIFAQSCSDEFKESQTYNQSRLYRELRLKHGKLISFLTYAQGMSMLSYTYVEPMFNISIPKLSKYMGKYNSNSSNKTKVNEIKEKKRKVNKSVVEQRVIPQIAHDVINYLNLKADKRFSSSSSRTVELINARCRDKYTLKDFKHVIDVKIADWSGGEYEKFIRPSTLFGNKFENYVNENIENKQMSKTLKKLGDTYQRNPYE